MTHDKLKEDGWKEWLDMNDLTGITENQKQMIRTAYDYGWYNAYGLESDERRHKEMIEAIEKLSNSLHQNNPKKNMEQQDETR